MVLGNSAAAGLTFASVAMAFAAAGMLLREVLSPARRIARPRPAIAPQAPEGAMSAAFFRLVEESGTLLDFVSWQAIVAGGALLGAGIPLALFDQLLIAAVGFTLGLAIPVVYLMAIRWRRISALQKQLSHDQPTIAVIFAGGWTLSEACQLVSQEIKGPLGIEFGYAYQQLELGLSPAGVVSRLVRRVPLPQFRTFAAAAISRRR
jgi:tight adherence protein B